MNCPREAEVWRAVEARHWPGRCDDELRAHVASCADCADLAEVASIIGQESDVAMRAAHVPPSGAVWWRTQLRARQEAARAARRAINVVQTAAVVIAVIGVLLIAGPTLLHLVAAIHWTLPVVAALATPLLLAPIAVYLAATD